MVVKPGCRVSHQDISCKLDVLFPMPASNEAVHVLSIDLPHFDTLSWLKAQSFPNKYYWVDRSGSQKHAAIGVLESVPEGLPLDKVCDYMQSRLKQCSPLCRYYGGMSFPFGDDDSEEWTLFGDYQFYLPEIELIETSNSVQLHIYSTAGRLERRYVELLLAKIEWDYSDINFSKAGVNYLEMSPNFEQWASDINTVKEHIKNGGVHKVVLSRKTSLTLNETGSGFDILAKLMELNDPRYYFLIQVSDDEVFFGHSPEQLCAISSDSVCSEAIAGSIARAQDSKKDTGLGEALLENNKNRDEHSIVKNAIQDALEPLCTDLEMEPNVSLLQLSDIQHLIARFKGTLNSDYGLGDVLLALHPTPAVCGEPKSSAGQLIDCLEPQGRGWYSGVVGFVSSDMSEFSVAIRSALVRDKHVHLYAGAGIVAESDPKEEWNELNQKVQLFLECYDVPQVDS